MHGEFIGVWSEMWREIWEPLTDEPLGENEEGIPKEIFRDLYRNLAKILKNPIDDAAIVLLIEDAVSLKMIFELSALRSGQQLTLEQIDEAFLQSHATELTIAGERRSAAEAALADLLEHHLAPFAVSLFKAQLQELAQDPKKVEEAKWRAIERIAEDSQKSQVAFKKTKAEDFSGELALVKFLESAYDDLNEFDVRMSARYINLLATTIEKFSLRYDLCSDLQSPCLLCPTLPGVFASLIRDLQALTAADPDLATLMSDYEDAVSDLRHGRSEGRIKTCIQKQTMLLEAIGETCPKVTKNTLGAMCDEIDTWPHEKVKEAMQNLYKFTSNFQGIRHGSAGAAKRKVEIRDLIAISIVLTGFTPYLLNQHDFDQIYLRA